MSIFEYDREWEEELLRKEEFEAGRDTERKNTEKERMNAEKERRRADSEKMRADSEKLRADHAERELLLLKEKQVFRYTKPGNHRIIMPQISWVYL